mmetsp:Transcript_14798/g.36144  ORF Transcript_14798/g.36144 Transcript_14798/m.36144 type:complete len:289 (-) Transcript_14798:193-1059(-)
MGRKRKNKKKEEVKKPFCYYCDREFVDEQTLIRHQKAKHFTCRHCFKKLGTVRGLVVHVAQLHKEVLTTIPGCKEGRENLELSISGMNGVPEEIIAEHYGLEIDKKQRANNGMPQAHHMGMSGFRGMPPGMPGMPPGMPPQMGSPPMMRGGFPPMQNSFPPPPPYMPPGRGMPMMPPPYGYPGMPPMPMGYPPRGMMPGQPMPMQMQMQMHGQRPPMPMHGQQQPPMPAHPPPGYPDIKSQGAQVNGTTGAASASAEPKLVYVFKGEGESMEEIRAKLSRYQVKPGNQ